MTVLRFERYPVDDADALAFDEAVQTLLSAMRAAPGALWADAARATDDPPSTIVLSEWRTSADAAAWADAAPVTSFVDRVDPYLRGEPTIRRFGDTPEVE